MAGDAPKAEFTEKMEEQLEALRAKFQEMELEQMKKGEVAARAKLSAAKKAVERKRKEVEDRLDTVRRASANAWEEARDGVDAAWDELQDAIERARKDFEGTLEEEDQEAQEKAS